QLTVSRGPQAESLRTRAAKRQRSTARCQPVTANESTNMRILLLTPRLPWPPTDGGRVAMSRLATSLAACGADVQVLSLNPRKHRGVPQGPLPIHAIDIDTSRFVIPARGVPYVVARFISREFREALQRCEADVVQIESPFMLPYARFVKNAKVVLRSLNVEFRI